jgi:hypothetical protein
MLFLTGCAKSIEEQVKDLQSHHKEMEKITKTVEKKLVDLEKKSDKLESRINAQERQLGKLESLEEPYEIVSPTETIVPSESTLGRSTLTHITELNFPKTNGVIHHVMVLVNSTGKVFRFGASMKRNEQQANLCHYRYEDGDVYQKIQTDLQRGWIETKNISQRDVSDLSDKDQQQRYFQMYANYQKTLKCPTIHDFNVR